MNKLLIILLITIAFLFCLMYYLDTSIKVDTSNKSPVIYDGEFENEEVFDRV